MLKKYPVSKNGIDYLITIEPDDDYYAWKAKLYTVRCRNFFRFKFKLKTQIGEQWYGSQTKQYSFSDIIYLEKVDFKEMCNSIINKYEEKVRNLIKINNEIEEANINFKTWDGKCQ